MAKESSSLAEAPVETILVDLESSHGVDNVATFDIIRERFEAVEGSLHVAEHPCSQTTVDAPFHGNRFEAGTGDTERPVNENGVWVVFVLVYPDLVAKIQD
jgi:hypothetical protein